MTIQLETAKSKVFEEIQYNTSVLTHNRCATVEPEHREPYAPNPALAPEVSVAQSLENVSSRKERQCISFCRHG
jgi:hypothetical protein